VNWPIRERSVILNYDWPICLLFTFYYLIFLYHGLNTVNVNAVVTRILKIKNYLTIVTTTVTILHIFSLVYTNLSWLK